MSAIITLKNVNWTNRIIFHRNWHFGTFSKMDLCAFSNLKEHLAGYTETRGRRGGRRKRNKEEKCVALILSNQLEFLNKHCSYRLCPPSKKRGFYRARLLSGKSQIRVWITMHHTRNIKNDTFFWATSLNHLVVPTATADASAANKIWFFKSKCQWWAGNTLETPTDSVAVLRCYGVSKVISRSPLQFWLKDRY